MRIIRLCLLFFILMYGCGLPVYANDLSVQGSNLSDCAQALPSYYSLQNKYRICQLRRARSLLYGGTSVCPGRVPTNIPGGCYPEDSSGNLVTGSHTPTSGVKPIINGNIGQVYGNRMFTYKNQMYRITETGAVQKRNGSRWNMLCTLILADVGCSIGSGNNSAGENQQRKRIDCSREYTRFHPELFKMTITRGTSYIDSVSRFKPPLNNYFRYYYCSITETATATAWE